MKNILIFIAAIIWLVFSILLLIKNPSNVMRIIMTVIVSILVLKSGYIAFFKKDY